MIKYCARKLVSLVELLENFLPRVHIYHIEDVFVICVLVTVSILGGGNYIEWVGVGAAFLAFKHTVVAFRLQEILEKEEEEGDTDFHGAGKQSQFYFAKEGLWLLYFALLGAWSGIVSVLIFLLYPIWHNFRVKYHTGTKHLGAARKIKEKARKKTSEQ